MRRREFIALLGGAAAAWPLAARAQQSAMPVIGFLSGQSREPFAPFLTSFHHGLKEADHVEGRTVAIEYRWANGELDQLPALAADLVSRGVSVLVAVAGAPRAAKAATATIPIVCTFGADPVAAGFVATFNRPGGNITGVSQLAYSLGPKRLEALRELLPAVRTIGVLINPSNPDYNSKVDMQQVEGAARSVGQEIEFLTASSEAELETVFAALPRRGVGALLVMADPFFNNRREQIVGLAASTAIPAIYEWRQFAAAGGLMSYGSSIIDAYRHLGVYAGRVLKGENPANLPVIQTVKVELVINLTTAKTLGLSFPPTLLARADEVIE